MKTSAFTLQEPSETELTTLRQTLAARFAQHPERHPGLTWPGVEARLAARPELWRPLYFMEATGGEPDVVVWREGGDGFVFVDCARESPAGRRSVCYDSEALAARKEHKPAHSAVGLAQEMGVELLNEAQYRALQQLGAFDTKTSSWLATPLEIRQRGGAIFGDRRYNHVFVYHNGAQSYYSSRGFRSWLQV